MNDPECGRKHPSIDGVRCDRTTSLHRVFRLHRAFAKDATSPLGFRIVRWSDQEGSRDGRGR